ncbi:ABC transporter substrate-binding protein [Pseudokineococcus sp. 1T1Z-3]|uniref:ABC transporter substrate-binding protein n=1 Tax=Pseudokineococcus sp. 1T1Z-3 TaxID=3132745 RepID=UPI00309F79E7
MSGGAATTGAGRRHQMFTEKFRPRAPPDQVTSDPWRSTSASLANLLPKGLLMTVTARRLLVGSATVLLLATTACGAGGAPAADERWRTATSAQDGGGMEQLVADAQAEGTFNAMGLYDDWANYGGVLATFSEKYGIEVVNDTSTGSSQDLVNAVINRQGQADSLDYLDTGLSFAEEASQDGLLARYSPETVDDVPEEFRSPDGTWINHLGGTMAIGCDASRVQVCPQTFADLLDPRYAGQVAIPGDPTVSETSFMVVMAAALASGGGFDDIGPGVDFFRQLNQVGNFLPVEANAGTIETGETPVVINWDYLLQPIADDLAASGTDLQITLPADGRVSSFYAASINADAPHPAVARLFMEFLFSDEGQNLLLEGYVLPIRLDTMVEEGTVDQDALAALPNAEGVIAPSPSLAQRAAAQEELSTTWVEAIQ